MPLNNFIISKTMLHRDKLPGNSEAISKKTASSEITAKFCPTCGKKTMFVLETGQCPHCQGKVPPSKRIILK